MFIAVSVHNQVHDSGRLHDSGRYSDPPLIYAVDDEPMILELTAAILEPRGYRVAGYRSGEKALKDFIAAGPRRPALLITDYALGPAGLMNGLELIERCRRIEPSQKVLLISGTVDEGICQKVASKPDKFLSKPYQAPQLLKLVRDLVGK